jgi:hypothetical protein
MTMKSLMIPLVKSENNGCLTELNHFLKRDYAMGGPSEQNIVTHGDSHPMNPSKGGIGLPATGNFHRITMVGTGRPDNHL